MGGGCMGSYRDDTFTGLAHRGDLEGIKNLLKNPNNHSNIEDTEGGIGYEGRAMTALGIAARRGDIAIMDELLSAGANPDGTGNWEEHYTATPLFAAVQGARLRPPLNGERRRNFGAVVRILHAGVDANCSMSAHPNTGGGATAMYYAAEHNDLEMATLLLSYGACLCIPNGNGYTPIDIARAKRHVTFTAWIERMSTHFVPDMNGGGTNYKMYARPYARPSRDQGMGSIVE
jgi:ankyrin repeat protein